MLESRVFSYQKALKIKASQFVVHLKKFILNSQSGFEPGVSLYSEKFFTSDEILSEFGTYLTLWCSVTILQRKEISHDMHAVPVVNKFILSRQKEKNTILNMINMLTKERELNMTIFFYCLIIKKISIFLLK